MSNGNMPKIQISKRKPLKKEPYLGYILTFALIIVNGSVVFSGNRLMLIAFLVLGIFLFWLKRLKIDSYFFYVIGFITLIVIVQTFNFAFFSYYTTFGTIVRFIMPYFLVKIIGKDFPKYYVKIMLVFTIIAFFFYVPSILFPPVYNLILKIPEFIGTDSFGEGTNFIIYTVESDVRMGVYRNSGFFWEPGAHAGFLIIALIFNTVLKNKFWNFENLFFFFAILSTFSTAGYIALFMTLFFYYASKWKRKGSIIFIAIVIFVSWYLYFQLDFLNEKISTEIELSTDSDKAYSGRLGSGEKDLQDIKEYPLFGRGRNVATRFENYNEADVLSFHRTNGVTDFIVKYGLLFGLFYFYSIYKSLSLFCIFNRYSKKLGFLMLIIVLTIGFSQTFFQGSIFISLMYMHLLFRKKYSINKTVCMKYEKINYHHYYS